MTATTTPATTPCPLQRRGIYIPLPPSKGELLKDF